jgi:hypothetical protein
VVSDVWTPEEFKEFKESGEFRATTEAEGVPMMARGWSAPMVAIKDLVL